MGDLPSTNSVGNGPQGTDLNATGTHEWLEEWKTVICAEVISAFTKCEELVLDPLLMHF